MTKTKTAKKTVARKTAKTAKAEPRTKSARGDSAEDRSRRSRRRQGEAKKLSALDAAAKVLHDAKKPDDDQGDDRRDGGEEPLDEPRRQDAARHALQRDPAGDRRQGEGGPVQEDRTRQVRLDRQIAHICRRKIGDLPTRTPAEAPPRAFFRGRVPGC